MKPKVRLPIWKAYLYSLASRYRRFKWINTGMLEFGMTNKEKGLLHGMLHKYLRKEVMRQVKAIQYYELVNIVLGSKISIATKEEIKLAEKLFISYKINTKELIMELKELKAFAKEVGLDLKKIKNMDEDELTLEILQNMDADKTYSDEFVEWYQELPDELFDDADAIEEEKPKGKGKKEKEEVKEEANYDDLIEAIEECTEVDELVEICQDEDFEEIFEDVDTDTKLVKKLKKAMLKAIEEYQEEAQEEPEEVEEEEKPKAKGKGKKETAKEEPVKEEKKKGRPAKEKEEPEEAELDDETKAELVEAINEATETEELKEIGDTVKDDYPELFKGISFRSGRGKSPYRDCDEVKAEMLEKLGVEVEEEEVEEGELEITAEAVNDAVEADDKETLIAMCEQLDIKLSLLLKKSAKKMGEKIIEVLPKEEKTEKRGAKGKAKKEEVEEVAEETEEKKSLFQLIEEMVEAEEDEKAIVKACEPILLERGKKKLFVAKFVRQMIEIVKSAQ